MDKNKILDYVMKTPYNTNIAILDSMIMSLLAENKVADSAESLSNALAEGKDVILEIEIQGALKVKEMIPETVLVFVTPPSAKELRNRLTGRGTETEEVINKRLSRAVEEAEGIENYDYIVINDELEQCVEDIHGIVMASRCRVNQSIKLIEEISKELSTISKGEEK